LYISMRVGMLGAIIPRPNRIERVSMVVKKM
jgi:hypothetical protein